ncbi:uncharacterized protein LOC110021799 [Phalaenopsis equestris]|uniref:uncharacterized protein LOC110021799 n=1 Tax=Phalaenopsis equestris TaxID=78828 RepID=UPI0009E2589F|nr:uncharacterized protein LOC110021799 [Phalaenopsis equestris]
MTLEFLFGSCLRTHLGQLWCRLRFESRLWNSLISVEAGWRPRPEYSHRVRVKNSGGALLALALPISLLLLALALSIHGYFLTITAQLHSLDLSTLPHPRRHCFLHIIGLPARQRPWMGERVGGWTNIPDAASNLEVRDLGCYSIDEYNRRLRGPGIAPIAFLNMLSARRQVFSGIKYHFPISAVVFHDNHHLTFDAIAVARTWIPEPSHDLISFTPSDD